jgi:D-alanyl-D-alanine carboxypeptidase
MEKNSKKKSVARDSQRGRAPLKKIAPRRPIPEKAEAQDTLATILTPPAVPNGLDEIIATFGDLRPYIQDDGTLSSKWETDEMTRSLLPFAIPLSGNPSAIVTKIECHHLLSEIFVQVFQEISASGLQDKVKTYGGCYAGRAKRTSTHWSAHAWGIAVDLNVETNQQGTKGDMDPGIIAIFRSHGFKWGGDFSGTSIDPMHFQYCTGY